MAKWLWMSPAQNCKKNASNHTSTNKWENSRAGDIFFYHFSYNIFLTRIIRYNKKLVRSDMKLAKKKNQNLKVSKLRFISTIFYQWSLPKWIWYLGKLPNNTLIRLINKYIFVNKIKNVELADLELCYSKCSLQRSSARVTWRLVRNADSQGPPQTYWIRFCILTRSPGHSYAHFCLRSTALEHTS